MPSTNASSTPVPQAPVSCTVWDIACDHEVWEAGKRRKAEARWLQSVLKRPQSAKDLKANSRLVRLPLYEPSCEKLARQWETSGGMMVGGAGGAGGGGGMMREAGAERRNGASPGGGGKVAGASSSSFQVDQAEVIREVFKNVVLDPGAGATTAGVPAPAAQLRGRSRPPEEQPRRGRARSADKSTTSRKSSKNSKSSRSQSPALTSEQRRAKRRAAEMRARREADIEKERQKFLRRQESVKMGCSADLKAFLEVTDCVTESDRKKQFPRAGLRRNSFVAEELQDAFEEELKEHKAKQLSQELFRMFSPGREAKLLSEFFFSPKKGVGAPAAEKAYEAGHDGASKSRSASPPKPPPGAAGTGRMHDVRSFVSAEEKQKIVHGATARKVEGDKQRELEQRMQTLETNLSSIEGKILEQVRIKEEEARKELAGRQKRIDAANRKRKNEKLKELRRAFTEQEITKEELMEQCYYDNYGNLRLRDPATGPGNPGGDVESGAGGGNQLQHVKNGENEAGVPKTISSSSSGAVSGGLRVTIASGSNTSAKMLGASPSSKGGAGGAAAAGMSEYDDDDVSLSQSQASGSLLSSSKGKNQKEQAPTPEEEKLPFDTRSLFSQDATHESAAASSAYSHDCRVAAREARKEQRKKKRELKIERTEMEARAFEQAKHANEFSPRGIKVDMGLVVGGEADADGVPAPETRLLDAKVVYDEDRWSNVADASSPVVLQNALRHALDNYDAPGEDNDKYQLPSPQQVQQRLLDMKTIPARSSQYLASANAGHPKYASGLELGLLKHYRDESIVDQFLEQYVLDKAALDEESSELEESWEDEDAFSGGGSEEDRVGGAGASTVTVRKQVVAPASKDDRAARDQRDGPRRSKTAPGLVDGDRNNSGGPQAQLASGSEATASRVKRSNTTGPSSKQKKLTEEQAAAADPGADAVKLPRFEKQLLQRTSTIYKLPHAMDEVVLVPSKQWNMFETEGRHFASKDLSASSAASGSCSAASSPAEEEGLEREEENTMHSSSSSSYRVKSSSDSSKEQEDTFQRDENSFSEHEQAARVSGGRSNSEEESESSRTLLGGGGTASGSASASASQSIAEDAAAATNTKSHSPVPPINSFAFSHLYQRDRSPSHNDFENAEPIYTVAGSEDYHGSSSATSSEGGRHRPHLQSGENSSDGPVLGESLGSESATPADDALGAGLLRSDEDSSANQTPGTSAAASSPAAEGGDKGTANQMNPGDARDGDANQAEVDREVAEEDEEQQNNSHSQVEQEVESSSTGSSSGGSSFLSNLVQGVADDFTSASAGTRANDEQDSVVHGEEDHSHSNLEEFSSAAEAEADHAHAATTRFGGTMLSGSPGGGRGEREGVFAFYSSEGTKVVSGEELDAQIAAHDEELVVVKEEADEQVAAEGVLNLKSAELDENVQETKEKDDSADERGDPPGKDDEKVGNNLTVKDESEAKAGEAEVTTNAKGSTEKVETENTEGDVARGTPPPAAESPEEDHPPPAPFDAVAAAQPSVEAAPPPPAVDPLDAASTHFVDALVEEAVSARHMRPADDEVHDERDENEDPTVDAEFTVREAASAERSMQETQLLPLPGTAEEVQFQVAEATDRDQVDADNVGTDVAAYAEQQKPDAVPRGPDVIAALFSPQAAADGTNLGLEAGAPDPPQWVGGERVVTSLDVDVEASPEAQTESLPAADVGTEQAVADRNGGEHVREQATIAQAEDEVEGHELEQVEEPQLARPGGQSRAGEEGPDRMCINDGGAPQEHEEEFAASATEAQTTVIDEIIVRCAALGEKIELDEATRTDLERLVDEARVLYTEMQTHYDSVRERREGIEKREVNEMSPEVKTGLPGRDVFRQAGSRSGRAGGLKVSPSPLEGAQKEREKVLERAVQRAHAVARGVETEKKKREAVEGESGIVSSSSPPKKKVAFSSGKKTRPQSAGGARHSQGLLGPRKTLPISEDVGRIKAPAATTSSEHRGEKHPVKPRVDELEAIAIAATELSISPRRWRPSSDWNPQNLFSPKMPSPLDGPKVSGLFERANPAERGGKGKARLKLDPPVDVSLLPENLQERPPWDGSAAPVAGSKFVKPKGEEQAARRKQQPQRTRSRSNSPKKRVKMLCTRPGAGSKSHQRLAQHTEGTEINLLHQEHEQGEYAMNSLAELEAVDAELERLRTEKGDVSAIRRREMKADDINRGKTASGAANTGCIAGPWRTVGHPHPLDGVSKQHRWPKEEGAERTWHERHESQQKYASRLHKRMAGKRKSALKWLERHRGLLFAESGGGDMLTEEEEALVAAKMAELEGEEEGKDVENREEANGRARKKLRRQSNPEHGGSVNSIAVVPSHAAGAKNKEKPIFTGSNHWKGQQLDTAKARPPASSLATAQHAAERHPGPPEENNLAAFRPSGAPHAAIEVEPSPAASTGQLQHATPPTTPREPEKRSERNSRPAPALPDPRGAPLLGIAHNQGVPFNTPPLPKERKFVHSGNVEREKELENSPADCEKPRFLLQNLERKTFGLGTGLGLGLTPLVAGDEGTMQNSPADGTSARAEGDHAAEARNEVESELHTLTRSVDSMCDGSREREAIEDEFISGHAVDIEAEFLDRVETESGSRDEREFLREGAHNSPIAKFLYPSKRIEIPDVFWDFH